MAGRVAGSRVRAWFAPTAIVTTAVLVVGLTMLAGSASATEPDTTPPVVVLSGSAIKAVEEEAQTGNYELHVAATDGSESEPQSGIAKIEVSVDGSGQQSWEKYCPEGNCSLEETWTWLPANFSGAYHVLAVKVTDHAGNTTEEEISPEGVEEVPCEHGYGTDTIPPKVSFSGTAVEAAETGATTGEYELRMLAKDGSSAEPQSGISKIEIAVDGTTLQSFEKYCPVGNCRLRVNWPYAPGNFSGTEHVITVTVRDHAGNVTTRTLELDRTPPTIAVSGALTEGLKEGTTEYPLHVHATDGEPEFPQSGVRKIEIAVDGETVETVEQTCRFGSCSMNAEWTFDTAIYGFEPHEIAVSAVDQAGNQETRYLPVAAPNGSIPACSSTGSVESPADEVEELPGGGKNYIYYGSDGELIEYPIPPTGFDPKTATAEELELYGYPPRPGALESEALEAWNETVGEAMGSAKPGGCMEVGGPDYEPEPNSESAPTTEYRPTFAGWTTQDPTGPKNEWRGASAAYVQPELGTTCPGAAVLSAFVGVEGPSGAFFQAGTNAPNGFVHDPNHDVAAFTEFFRAGDPGLPSERPIHQNLLISPGDPIFAESLWLPEKEAMLNFVEDLETKETTHHRVRKVKGTVYDGRELDFKIERQSSYELQNFGSLRFYDAFGAVTGEGWRPLGALEHRRRLEMQQFTAGSPTGNLMASTGNVSANGKSFLLSWHHCHP